MSLSAYIKSVQSGLSSGALGNYVLKASIVDTPNAANENLFQVTGGYVLVTMLMGIRTIIQAGGASNVRFNFGATNISAATATTATDAIGTVYSVTGNYTDNVVIGAGTGVVNTCAPTLGGIAGGISTAEQYQKGILCGLGVFYVTWSAAAATGSCRYVIRYVPLEPGASIIAL